MSKTIENDLLFDDVQMIESKTGLSYLTFNAENLGKDGNCSSYTSIEDDEFSAA